MERERITILAALMLLVSVSTVLAVRTHQRNLTQLTAQNIEALTGGEGFWETLLHYYEAFKSFNTQNEKEKNIYDDHETDIPRKCFNLILIDASMKALYSDVIVDSEGRYFARVEGTKVNCLSKQKSRCFYQECN